MKRVLLLCALFCVHLGLKAQKVYFIYLQSENAAPFYIKMAGQIRSSTTEGYLIIPKLTDSTYVIALGQPGKQNESRFSITINKGDRGFLIKNFDGVPGLFDLQTLAVYKPIAVETGAIQTIMRNDNFTTLLAKAADDTTILFQAVVMQKTKQEPQPELIAVKEDVSPKQEVEIVPKSNSAKISATGTIAQPGNTTGATSNEQKASVAEKSKIIPEPEKTTTVDEKQKGVIAPVEEEYKKSVITKRSESSTSEGFGLVFLDAYNGEVDTVQIIIPNPKMSIPDTSDKITETKQFLDISSATKDTAVLTPEKTTSEKLKAQCASVSTDDDFFKLRRDMTSKNSDEEMIAQAKKYFKAKCYRTEQIKYLSALFLTDESKYQFFDAAYMHVSDQERFPSLQLELKDNYYVNRFKALIGN
jgi:hypothetical protein